MPSISGLTTIYGLIARYIRPAFWGRITIDKRTGLILKVEEGRDLEAEHVYGPAHRIFAGFAEVHMHARQDNTGNQNYKETYQTAGDAALNGGLVLICAMPNTPDPVRQGQQFHWHRNHVLGLGHPVVILNYIGVDKGTRPLGKHTENPYKCYFGKSVGSLTVTFASELDAILSHYRGEHVSFHVEYEPVVLMFAQGKTHSDRRPVECVNEGLRHLLPLIEKYEIKAKLCHWSTGGESLKLIEEYRDRGCEILLEVSPLHLLFDTSMTDEDPSLWSKIQMNPAIQGPQHRLELIKGLKNGTIDMLATDHAPHTEDEKFLPFGKFSPDYPGKSNKEIASLMREENALVFERTCVESNTSGAPWLDTYALVCTWLMREHGFTTLDIASVAAYNPGQFVNQFLPSQFPDRDFGEGFGDIEEGYMGSLTVLNLEKETLVERKNLKTKVGWSPLEGRTLPGAVEAVFIAGEKY